MMSHVRHLRGENTLGTVQSRKRSVKLYHMAANAGLPLHHVHLLLPVGNVECRLHPCDAAANNKYVGIEWRFFDDKRLVVIDSLYGCPD